MVTSSRHGGRRGSLLAAAATAVLAAVGATTVYLGVAGTATTSAPQQSPTSSAGQPSAGAGSRTTDAPDAPRSEPAGTAAPVPAARTGRFLTGSRPVGLDIARIGVHSTTVVDLGLQRDGSIEVPEDAQKPGWFAPGPSPGQLGPAVIAGHVDSRTGPAVFYRLAELRRGDRLTVTREDGSVAAFVVDRVKTYAKDAFPTRKVYGATDRAELRLITCGGSYDDETGYDSNTVAYAHLVQREHG